MKKQQEILLNSENHYKSLFYSNSNPFWIYDLDTLKFLEVNHATIQIYGYSREEFKHMTILNICTESDQKRIIETARTLKDYRISGNWKHIKKNGKEFNVSVTSHRIKYEHHNCAVVMAHDMTTRLNYEEKLKLAYGTEKKLKEELETNINLIKQSLIEKQRLAEVVDRINNMVIITDAKGIVTWVNQAFINFTGYSYDEAVGNTCRFLHGPKTNIDTPVTVIESIRRNELPSFEIVNYTKSGHEYWVEINISPIYTAENKLERYISIQNIITERKEREAKIKAYNQNLRKLAWTNSHAFRKPVASILSLVALSKDMDDFAEVKEIHSLIELCTSELDDITKKIGKGINDHEADNINL